MLSVLLVDDNRTFLRVLTEFLAKNRGGALRVAGSVVGGGDAVAHAETLQPDVVLVDLHMPLQSGMTLLPRRPNPPESGHVSGSDAGGRRGCIRLQDAS